MTRDEALAVKTMGELFDKDLAGWQLKVCDYLVLKDVPGVRGLLFPAQVDDEIKTLFVPEERLVRRIRTRLPPANTTNHPFLAVVHLEAQRGFNLGNTRGREAPYFHLRTEAEIEELIRRNVRFHWPKDPVIV